MYFNYLTNKNFNEISSEHESEPDEVDEPIRERKKRKMVYKEPRAKAKARLTGMQQQQQQPEKTKKKKVEIPPEQRKSTRQSTVEQRACDEEFEEPQRKKYTKKMHKQLTQVGFQFNFVLTNLCFNFRSNCLKKR